MRRLGLMIIAAAAVTAVSTPSFAAYREQTVPFCFFGRGCVPMTTASYNACRDLATQRGERPFGRSDQRDRRSFELFIYQCLSGKIPF